jgi:DNA-binding response OmpR family regulator
MPCVIVVEDDLDVRDVLATGLELAGACRVIAVSGAGEAKAALTRELPDAAVIDIGLPGSSGLDLARDFAERDVPVLLISGSMRHIELLEAVDCLFLAKPFKINRMVEELQALLRDREQGLKRLRACFARLP